mmetsp:Transcript_44708/g.137954  ORF Transcript_44708/g.137954 Transcript_44708/m.137954 type:complete len:221 (-) Transcript_44708:257-919(-)
MSATCSTCSRRRRTTSRARSWRCRATPPCCTCMRCRASSGTTCSPAGSRNARVWLPGTSCTPITLQPEAPRVARTGTAMTTMTMRAAPTSTQVTVEDTCPRSSARCGGLRRKRRRQRASACTTFCCLCRGPMTRSSTPCTRRAIARRTKRVRRSSARWRFSATSTGWPPGSISTAPTAPRRCSRGASSCDRSSTPTRGNSSWRRMGCGSGASPSTPARAR